MGFSLISGAEILFHSAVGILSALFPSLCGKRRRRPSPLSKGQRDERSLADEQRHQFKTNGRQHSQIVAMELQEHEDGTGMAAAATAKSAAAEAAAVVAYKEEFGSHCGCCSEEGLHLGLGEAAACQVHGDRRVNGGGGGNGGCTSSVAAGAPPPPPPPPPPPLLPLQHFQRRCPARRSRRCCCCCCKRRRMRRDSLSHPCEDPKTLLAPERII